MSYSISSLLLLSLVSSLSVSASDPKGFCFYQGSSYEYGSEVSKESKEVSEDLRKDITDLFSELSSQSKVMTFLDLRDLSNKFFIKHSLSIPFDSSVTDFVIPTEQANGDDDESPVASRLYRSSHKSRRLVFFMHGGGWVQGNLDTHDYLCKRIATILECTVLAVNYRLAPENRFPKGLHDVTRAYKWLMSSSSHSIGDSAVEIGEFDEIYFCGDSAGGNLAVALTLNLNKEDWKGRMPNGLLLFYPPLSDQSEGGSFEAFGDQIALSAAGSVKFFEQYMGTSINSKEFGDNMFIFPLKAPVYIFLNLKIFMVAAGCDVLLDGQIALYEKLKKAGILVQLLINKGAVHGFMTFGKEFDESVCYALKEIRKWMD